MKNIHQTYSSLALWQKILYATVILGLITHGYAMTSHYFAHDSIREMVALSSDFDNISLKISTGRFVQVPFFYLRGFLSVPWLLGGLALLYTGLTAYFLAKIFPIPTPTLLLGVFLTRISLTLTFSFYVHETDMHALAILFATLTAYVYHKFPKGYVFAPFLIVLVCGLYQAIYAMVILLFMLLLVQRIFRKESPFSVIK